MRYFVRASGGLMCKNQLQEDIYKELQKFDCLIVDSTPDMIRLRNDILLMIEFQNKKYNRCKPVAAKFWCPDDTCQALELGGHQFAGFFIYEAKN